MFKLLKWYEKERAGSGDFMDPSEALLRCWSELATVRSNRKSFLLSAASLFYLQDWQGKREALLCKLPAVIYRELFTAVKSLHQKARAPHPLQLRRLWNL
jgi:hypothetical protein